jgi:hypothetical protein
MKRHADASIGSKPIDVMVVEMKKTNQPTPVKR